MSSSSVGAVDDVDDDVDDDDDDVGDDDDDVDDIINFYVAACTLHTFNIVNVAGVDVSDNNVAELMMVMLMWLISMLMFDIT